VHNISAASQAREEDGEPIGSLAASSDDGEILETEPVTTFSIPISDISSSITATIM